jgi:hypothetical protein
MGIGLLQDLYRCIATLWENADDASPDAVIRRDQLDGFQHVIGTIIVLEAPLGVHQITALLADIPEDKFDVTNFLQQMRSVLILGTTGVFRTSYAPDAQFLSRLYHERTCTTWISDPDQGCALQDCKELLRYYCEGGEPA